MGRLLSARARPLRFLVTGGTTGAFQLALVAALTHRGWADLPANATAFLLAAELNFILSWQFTWRDRHSARAGSRWPATIAALWAAFHASIAGTAALNQSVFLLARMALPTLAASALGIATGAAGNYLLGNRLIFRAPTSRLGADLAPPPACAPMTATNGDEIHHDRRRDAA